MTARHTPVSRSEPIIGGRTGHTYPSAVRPERLVTRTVVGMDDRPDEGTRTFERLFVYGTLAPGRPNEHVLANLSGEWQPATTNGELLQEGWGASVGFPGIVLDEYGQEVHGLLFSSEQLSEHWERLDDFEGDGYERVLTSVKLRSGEAATAYVYVLRASSLAVESAP